MCASVQPRRAFVNGVLYIGPRSRGTLPIDPHASCDAFGGSEGTRALSVGGRRSGERRPHFFIRCAPQVVLSPTSIGPARIGDPLAPGSGVQRGIDTREAHGEDSFGGHDAGAAVHGDRLARARHRLRHSAQRRSAGARKWPSGVFRRLRWEIACAGNVSGHRIHRFGVAAKALRERGHR